MSRNKVASKPQNSLMAPSTIHHYLLNRQVKSSEFEQTVLAITLHKVSNNMPFGYLIIYTSKLLTLSKIQFMKK